jgi:hypothetical protein
LYEKPLAAVVVTFGTVTDKATADPTQTAAIGAFELRLSQLSNRCMLTYTAPPIEGSFELQLSPPCDFHRHLDGKPRVISLSSGAVILVESSGPNFQHPGDCKTQIQGIRITKQQVFVSQRIAKVASCPPFQWDEKMFIGLFD